MATSLVEEIGKKSLPHYQANTPTLQLFSQGDQSEIENITHQFTQLKIFYCLKWSIDPMKNRNVFLDLFLDIFVGIEV